MDNQLSRKKTDIFLKNELKQVIVTPMRILPIISKVFERC